MNITYKKLEDMTKEELIAANKFLDAQLVKECQYRKQLEEQTNAQTEELISLYQRAI